MITRRAMLVGAASLAASPILPARAMIGITLVYDTVIRAIPTVAKPGYQQSYIDQYYHSKITRISGDPGTTIPVVGGTWPTVCKPHYPKDQAWNADETMIYVLPTGISGGMFLQGDYPYGVLFKANGKPSSSSVIWHHSDPALMVYAAGSVLGTWNPQTGAKVTINTFTGYTSLNIGKNEGNLSVYGQKIVLTAIRSSDNHAVCFAYDILTGTKYADIDATVRWGAPPDPNENTLSNCSISPTGTYIQVQHYQKVPSLPEQTTIFTLNGVVVSDWAELGAPSHYDMTIDTTGAEVACGVDKGSAGTHGWMIKRNLITGAITPLTGGDSYLSHTSCRDFVSNQPWAYGTYEIQPTALLYSGELVAAITDASKVYRLCHHHNTHVTGDYDSETHGSVSPGGSRMIFASNWGGAGGRPVQTYICDLR